MIETATALLFAHVLADFVFQSDWINRNKRNPGVLLVHGAIVALTAFIALGFQGLYPVLILAAAHLAIDALKTYGGFSDLRAFLLDQGAHLITIAFLAALTPALWHQGAWAAWPALLPLMALGTGLIITLRVGEFAVGLLMRPYGARVRNNGLRNGGRVIGMLERGLIFLLVMIGQPIGVGFLVAAKSILRFGTANRDQHTAEYVIIGTLTSFGWALLATYATQGLMKLLPPLEITSLIP